MMLVNRRTFTVKRGKLEEAVEFAIAEMNRINQKGRIFVPVVTNFDKLVIEEDFENLAEYERTWDEWEASPESVPFLEKWFELTETGGTNEIWKVTEV